jgi:AP2 domain
MHPESTAVRITLAGRIPRYTLVDATDADWVSQWRWSFNGRYAVRWAGGTTVYLHRELLGLVPGNGLQADHINRDCLDNRRRNLRRATQSLNTQNLSAKGRSHYRGVNWDSATGKWRADISIGGVRYRLGRFTDELEAAAAAQNARLLYMPYATD